MPASQKKAASPAALGMDGFVPLVELNKALHFWWIIFIMVVAGGLVGLLVHLARPPLYEAAARLSASIDFVNTGPLSQYEEDVALNAVADLINSRLVVDAAVQLAAESGFKISESDLRSSATLERKFTTYELRLRSADPAWAQRAANAWAEQAHLALLESSRHALEADRLLRALRELESCLGETAVSEPSAVGCSQAQMANIQAEMEALGAVYSQERESSNGISSALLIGPLEQADLPTRADVMGRGLVVLAGCVLGFLAGVWLIYLNLPSRWIK